MSKSSVPVSEKFSAMFEQGFRLFEAEKYVEAAQVLQQVYKVKPVQVAPYKVYAATLLALKKYQEALDVLESGKAIDPEGYASDAEIPLVSCKCLESLRDYARLIEVMELAHESFPQDNKIKSALVKGLIRQTDVLRSIGEFQEALNCANRAYELAPESPDVLNTLAIVFIDTKQGNRGVQFLIDAARKDPSNVAIIMNLANCFEQMGEPEMAIGFYDQAMKMKPDMALAMCGKATIFCSHGLSQEYIDLLEKGVELLHEEKGQIGNLITHFSNYLFNIHYVPEMPRQKIFDQTKKWYEVFCSDIESKPRLSFENPPDKDKKLRIGMITQAVRRHPVTWMTISALKNINKEQFEVYLYSDNPIGKEDDVTEVYSEQCDHVTQIFGKTNEEVTKIVRADNIDVLIELTGHSEGGKRMYMAAARVAPVQVKWVGGLFDTTGVPQMDWIFGDKIEIPEGDEKWYTERVYRMPDDYIVYEPPYYIEGVKPLPAQKNGFVTFGNMNNLAKTNTYTIAVWSKILKAVPGSRLLMKVNKMDTPFAKHHVEQEFAKNGIGIDRLILEGGEPHKPFMETYHRIDIALDPHPYTGGLTTCEAMWMGVPVVTLPGETFAGRHAATHLYHGGLPDWIAKDEEDYINIAVKWANDLEGLAKLRAGLREQVAKSPLTDGPRFARNLEKALRHMWVDWCDEKMKYEEGQDAPKEISPPKPKKSKAKSSQKRKKKK